MLDRIHELYDGLERQQIMLCFKGELDEKLIGVLLELVERKMQHIEPSSKMRKRVFNVLMECMQNLYHHSHDPKQRTGEEDLDREGILLISKTDGGYSVLTGNYMQHAAVETLQGRLDKINDLDQDQLHALYRQVLNNGSYSEKGGGGLGMIDIARKSKSKLEYAFIEGSGKNAFFSLNVNVGE